MQNGKNTKDLNLTKSESVFYEKIVNCYEKLTKFNAIFLSTKRASDISPFPLVPRGPLGPLILPSC